MEYIWSIKQKTKIIRHNYLYNLNKEHDNHESIYYWVCENKPIYKTSCRATAVTYTYNSNYYLINERFEHSCKLESSQVDVLDSIQELKNIASNSIRKDGNCKLVQEIVNSTNFGSQTALPSLNALNQIVSRVKNAKFSKDPIAPKEYSVDKEYEYCNGEKFFFKKLINNDDLIFIFTTHINLRHLSSSKFMIMDGTFSVVPKGLL